MSAITRRRAALMISAAAMFGMTVAGARAQDTHTGGQGGRGGGGGHTPGGASDDHTHDDQTQDDHTHDDQTQDDHTHDDHDDVDHTDRKRGPRYRGGRASTEALGRGYGRSLEDRVLKPD